MQFAMCNANAIGNGRQNESQQFVTLFIQSIFEHKWQAFEPKPKQSMTAKLTSKVVINHWPFFNV